MRRFIWFGSVAIALLVAIGIGVSFLRISPFPTPEEMQDAQRQRHAERLRDRPSVEGTSAIEPMRIEQALILDYSIAQLSPGERRASTPFHLPENASQFPEEMDFRIEYSRKNDNDPPSIIVEVQQFGNEVWPLYFAKWSPTPDLLREENPALVLTRVNKFKNQIVMDRQFLSRDGSGMRYFWPSGKNLVVVRYRSNTIEEELLRRYLEKYPSSLQE